VIRIGRSTDNHVILYSAVVSRHHVELRQIDRQWEIVNLGANGTYLDGKQITQVPVVDGVIIRLARSGPNIQIHLGSTAPLPGEKMLAQRAKTKPEATGSPVGLPPTPPGEAIKIPPTRQLSTDLDNQAKPTAQKALPQFTLSDLSGPDAVASPAADAGLSLDCSHHRAQPDMLFCPDCGQPLRFLDTIGEYQVMKTLHEDQLGVTQLVWRNGQSLLLKSLSSAGLTHPGAVELFEQQAQVLLKLQHPNLPRFIDFFVLAGRPCLIQEQVYGQNLHQRVLTQGPLSQKQAIDSILQVCNGLSYLHQQPPPFLHQNLKPENLIHRLPSPASGSSITITGFVPLSALRMDTQPTLIGGYSAPEQQQGHVTQSSDLYALGPILVYLITGREPNAFYAQREQGYRFYPEYIPGLTPALVTIVRRLTNSKPQERYASAAEVAAALAQLDSPIAEKL
jgi:serine/threonine-protein kinase